MARTPLRGEIWFVQLPTDPPGKGCRPVVIASVDARNRHERADTVLVAPLATSIHRDSPVQVLLAAGETGLASDSAARGDSITVVYKQDLAAPRGPLRRLSNTGICELATKVNVAMSCVLCHARDSDF